MTHTRYAAVLFDLDGTLVDSVPDLSLAIDAMLKHYDLPCAGIDKVGLWVGNGARILVERALVHQSGTTQIDVAEAHQVFLQAYGQSCSSASRCYPNVRETLEQLKLLDVKMAVVTNKPIRFVGPLLRHLAIDQYFSQIIGGECLPTRKPDPLMLETAIELLGMQNNPKACLMVGDSANDIEAAKASNICIGGIANVCVDYGYSQGLAPQELGADYVISDFADLLAIVRDGEPSAA